MKILTVMGSPRKGESYKVMKLIEDRLAQKGDVDFEYLYLKNYSLGNCKGCHLCITDGKEKCPLRDDRDRIVDKMLAADGVIFVSPVYSMHVTALMKNFIDHLSYLYHRPMFFGKKAMAVSAGGASFKDTLGYMESNAKAWGFHFVNKLGVPHLDSLTPKYKEKIMKKIDTEADKFYNSVKENHLPVPGIGDLMWFNMWKGNAIACKKSLPSDYPYWKDKGWMDSDYFYKTRVNIWKKGVLKLFGLIGKMYMSRIYVGY
jgi:Multimeric flavodoxin WrbA